MKTCLRVLLIVAISGCSLAAHSALLNPLVYRDSIDMSPYRCGSAGCMAIVNNLLYFSGDGDGSSSPVLWCVDASNPDNLQYVSKWGCCYKAPSFSIVDNRLYLAHWFHYLHIFDISTPGVFNFIGDFDVPESTASWGVKASNGRAYVVEAAAGSPYNGLRILNVSDPENVSTISRVNAQNYNVSGPIVRGSYAYYGDSTKVKIANISDENNPYELELLDLGQIVGALALRGDYLYAAVDNGGGLYVIDVSDPYYPTVVGHCANIAGIGMHLMGNYAFIAGAGLHFQTVDISNPSNPVKLFTTYVERDSGAQHAYEYSCTGRGKYVYVGDQQYFTGQDMWGWVYSYQAFTEDPDNMGPGIWTDFSADTAAWNTEYTGDSLPTASSPVWQVYEGSESYGSCSGGILRVNDNGGASNQKIKWIRNWEATYTRGATVLVRARCASYDLNGGALSMLGNIGIEDGKRTETFAILTDRIRATVSNREAPIDGTVWHTYRITTQAGQYAVYVDESPTPLLTGSMTSSTTRARIWFGSGSSTSLQDIYFDYIQCCSNGAAGPGATTTDITPDLGIKARDVTDPGSVSGLSPAHWSTDGGATWSSSGGSLWSCLYEADALPSIAMPAWDVPEGSEIYASVASGALRVYDDSTVSGSKVKFSRNWNASASTGTTVFARVRCAALGANHSLGGNIFIEDGGYKEIFKIWTDRIEATQSATFSGIYDATQFHTYRITSKNGVYDVYLDENPTPVLTGSMVVSMANNRVMFGSGASAGTQDIYFDYVRYTTEGDLPAGEGDGGGPVPVTCTAQPGDPYGVVSAAGVPFNQASETLNRVKFSVRDTNGNVGYSPVYNVRIVPPVGPPGPVTGFAATRGDGQVSLAWTNPGDADFARTVVRYKTTGFPTGPTDGTEVYNGSGTACVHSGLTNGVMHYYSAWAVDTEGLYSTKSDASATPTDLTPPAPVAAFTAAPGNRQVTLNWTNPTTPDFTGTMVRYKTTGYPAGPTDGTLLVNKLNSPGSADSYTHTGAGNGITYYYAAFAHDTAPNYASAANSSATPSGEDCFFDAFSYPNGNLNGQGGWAGPSASQIEIVDQTVKINGGAGDYYVIHAASCGGGASGVISARVKIRAGVGTGVFMWNLWIDDPNGKNLARWYGSGTSARGRIGGSAIVTNSQALTGGWDTLEVRIYTATDQSEFFVNGTSIGLLSHSSQLAGDSVGSLTFERMDNAGAAGHYVYFDDLLLSEADPAGFGPPQAKMLADTQQAIITVGVVSAVFGDSFYVQCVDANCGLCGIKVVKAGHDMQVGQSAIVHGSALTDPATGERYIAGTWVDGSGSGTADPIGVTNLSLGGSEWNYIAGTGAGQAGVEDATGTNNIGLLVRVWGVVTQRDESGLSYFYIDDGSNLRDTTTTGAAANVGVRAKANPTGYLAGTHVVVTGISSCFKDGSGRIRRLVIPVSVE